MAFNKIERVKWMNKFGRNKFYGNFIFHLLQFLISAETIVERLNFSLGFAYRRILETN